MEGLLDSGIRNRLILFISIFVGTSAFAKDPWIPAYPQPKLDSVPIDRIASEDLKDLTARKGDWGKVNGMYIYLPKEQSVIPSKDSIYLLNFLWSLSKAAYQCAVEPIRSYTRKELTLKKETKEWMRFSIALLHVFNKCVEIPGYLGKYAYAPLERLERLLDWNYVWILNSDQYFLYVTDRDHIIISRTFLEEFTSDAMVAALTFYGRLVGRENDGKIDSKEIEKAFKEGDFKKANAIIRNQIVIVESLAVEKLKHSLHDKEITDALVKKEFHPGSWYSVLKVLEYLQQKGISSVLPIREHLGNIIFRLSNLKRYLDRKNYNKAGKILNSSDYMEDMKKAGIKLRLLNMETVMNEPIEETPEQKPTEELKASKTTTLTTSEETSK